MSLAIFDLDNTLIRGDSDHAWGEFLVREGVVNADEHQRANDRFYQEYLDGSLDIHRYLAFALEPLTRLDPAELGTLRRRFMSNCVEPMGLSAAFDLLRRHREDGHTLLIITATNRFVTQPIADWLGVDDLIATEPEMTDGRYTGRVSGTPSFRDGKVARLEAWLEGHHHDLNTAWFYSDSHNDLPLLERVGHPVAVDPDPTLDATARERGWPVLSLREE